MTAAARAHRARLRLARAAVACLALALPARGQAAGGPSVGGPPPLAADARIVAVGAALAETVVALGAGARIVGVDDGSAKLSGLDALPRLGYARTLSAEGVLSLRPDVLLAGDEAGPPQVLEQLRAAGLRVEIVAPEASAEGAALRIETVARLLGRREEGARLAAELRVEVDALRRALAALAQSGEPAPRVLFVYARGAGSLHVSGRGTPADSFLRLAGAENAVTGFEGYASLSAEAAVVAAPDVIVIPAGSLAVLGGEQALLEHRGLALTPAGRARRIVALDDTLLGFGPRTGRMARELAARLRPALAGAPGPGASGPGER